MHDIALLVSVFIATLVEAVEALTIVLAVGLSRGWKAARRGTVLGLITVALVIVSFGPLLLQFPVEMLRLIVGLLSLIFGLQWLRKAILRSSGYKAMHDEVEIFKRELAAAKRAKAEQSFFGDRYAFTITYKAVLIEGIEVAFLVVAFGSIQGKLLEAAASAGLACILIIASGFVLHKPLNEVPENSMKFTVGAILTTFGIFWCTEGVGLSWSLQDLVLFPLLALVVASSFVAVYLLRKKKTMYPESKAKLAKQPKLPTVLEFLYDLLIGDDWPTAVIVYLTVVIALAGFGFEWIFASVIVSILLIRLLLIAGLGKPSK